MQPFYHGGSAPLATLKRWAKRMRFFRICGSHGGHFDDGDTLRVLIAIPTVEATLDAFRAQGHTIEFKKPADIGTNSGYVLVGGMLIYILGMTNGHTGI